MKLYFFINYYHVELIYPWSSKSTEGLKMTEIKNTSDESNH